MSSNQPDTADPNYTHTTLEAIERIDNDGIAWRPIRRALGITGFGINAYSAEKVGDLLIEPHDETSLAAGGHEELYLVTGGVAKFTIGGTSFEAATGSLVFVPVGVSREAVAAAPDTTVLVIGGKPGAGLPVSPFEYWYAAQGAVNEHEFQRAISIASEGLADWPAHGHLNYQLACYHALAGDRVAAVRHLRIAFANDPRTRNWAVDDDDLVDIRDDPSLAP